MTDIKRPVLRFNRTRLEWNLEILTLIAVAAGFIIVFVSWSTLPERIPVHFGFDGLPNGWHEGKGWILFLPVVDLAFYLMFLIVGRKPHLFNFAWEVNEKNAPRQYRLAVAFITVLKTELK